MKKILYILLLGAIISSCSKFDGDDYAIDIFADLPIVTKYPIASDIYDTQVKFSGSISESQTGVTVAGFYISQEKELLGEDLAFEAPEIVDFEFSTWIDGLERDTRYYACAYGVAGDEIIIGNTVTFATSTDEIPNVKFEGKAYVEASNAIDVSIYCNIDEEEGANREQIRQYGIKYWLDNEEEAQSVAINYGDSNFYYDTGKGLLVPITNILPNTQYNYRFFAYSTPTIDIREPQEGDETMEGTECVKPTLTDFDAQFVGNSMIRVIATVADTGNDPTVEYGFRVTAGSSETVDYKLSPVYDDDTRTSNDTDYTYLIDNLASAQDVVVEAYITNTILRDYGTEGEVYEATEEKTFTTTDVDESVWTLSQFSDVSYPTTDNWVIMQGTDYVASSTVFDGFKAALRALWKSAPEREISVTLLDFDSIPGSAIGFGTSESDWTYNLVEVTLSSATIVYGTTVQYAQGLRKFSAPYAVSMKNQAISHNPALEVIELPRMVTIDGYRTLYDNLSLKRVNSDVDGEVNFPELTTINNVDLLSNSAATASPYITSVSMPKLETVAITSGSIIGTDTYLQLESLSMPVLTDGTCVFTTANTTLTEVDMPELTAIPDEAFEGNTNLTQLNFPKLVSVGQEAFKNCTNLTSICGYVTSARECCHYWCWCV